ncbi:MAG: hypothetical protein AABZ60_04780, partial [Planctomycetota bacterium]
QPQAPLDSEETIHLIYFKGIPKAGNLFYVFRKLGDPEWSKPIQINTQDESAIAVGNIRGAQLALGQEGKIHVVWNGSASAEPQGIGGNPMLYTRSNKERTMFEPQRNLITQFGGIDGGGSVAADLQGNVYVTWHATGEAKEESGRAVYLAYSQNNGEIFASERRINPGKTGACACCGMRAFIDQDHSLYIANRAEKNNSGRDMMILLSKDKGKNFKEFMMDHWEARVCPMSSVFLAEGKSGVFAAWETEQQVFFSLLKNLKPIAASKGDSNTKHPVLVINAKEEILLAWIVGMKWNTEGSLAWQIYDKKGQPTSERGKTEGVPIWSLITAVTYKDGHFVVIY